MDIDANEKRKDRRTHITGILITAAASIVVAYIGGKHVGIQSEQDKVTPNIAAQNEAEYSRGYETGYEEGKLSVLNSESNDMNEVGEEQTSPENDVEPITFIPLQYSKDGNPVSDSKLHENGIIDEGIIYVPLNDIKLIVDTPIMWDYENQTINVGKNPEADQPTKWILELDRLDQSAEGGWSRNTWDVTKKANNGDTYAHGGIYSGDYINGMSIMERKDDGQYITYGLEAKYSEFKGTIALSHSSRDTKSVCVILMYLDYGDGNFELKYTSDEITGGIEPFPFKVNVEGVTKIKIETHYYSYGGVAEIGIVNAGFYA